MSAIYIGKATATGEGRNGHVDTSDGKVRLDLSYPKDIGGSGAGTNPEQLVAMGYAACFLSALGLVAQNQKIVLADAEVTCNANLHRAEDGGFSLTFEITAHLPGLEQATANALVATTHTVCPYSKGFTHGAQVSLRAVT